MAVVETRHIPITKVNARIVSFPIKLIALADRATVSDTPPLSTHYGISGTISISHLQLQ